MLSHNHYFFSRGWLGRPAGPSAGRRGIIKYKCCFEESREEKRKYIYVYAHRGDKITNKKKKIQHVSDENVVFSAGVVSFFSIINLMFHD
jgi:hypothetical protein